MSETQDPSAPLAHHEGPLALAAAREHALADPDAVRCCRAIGERVKRLRWERRLTRADLSTRSGLARQSLLLIENGWLADDDQELMVDDLATALDVSADDLWAVASAARPVPRPLVTVLLARIQRIGSEFTVQPYPAPALVRRGGGTVGSAGTTPDLEVADRDGELYLQARLGPSKSGALLSLHRAADSSELARTVLDGQGAGVLRLPDAVEGEQLLLQATR